MFDITVVGYQNWRDAVYNKGIFSRDLHIITNLTKQPEVNNVLMIERPVSLAEQLIRKTGWKFFGEEEVDSGSGYILYKIKGYKNFYVLSQYVSDIILPIFYNRFWWDKIFKRNSIIKHIDKSKKLLGMSDDVLYLFTPFALSTHCYIKHNFFIFDVVDNFIKHIRISNREKNKLKNVYKTIGEQADMISCVSPEARDALFTVSKAIKEVIYNGVEKRWLSLTPKKPEELMMYGSKLIGFVGHFSKKFDKEFLIELSYRMSDIIFILLGRVFNNNIIKSFKGIKNIKYLGEQPYDKLPSYYYHFDATIILYKPEKENDGDPLKMYESLSLGTPIVSLPSKGVHRFPEVVKVESELDKFVISIREILSHSKDFWRDKCRSALTKDEFWDLKVEKITSLIISNLNK